MTAISPVHWRDYCCLATSHNIHPIVACAYRGVFIEPLPSNALSISVTLLLFHLPRYQGINVHCTRSPYGGRWMLRRVCYGGFLIFPLTLRGMQPSWKSDIHHSNFHHLCPASKWLHSLRMLNRGVYLLKTDKNNDKSEDNITLCLRVSSPKLFGLKFLSIIHCICYAPVFTARFLLRSAFVGIFWRFLLFMVQFNCQAHLHNYFKRALHCIIFVWNANHRRK